MFGLRQYIGDHGPHDRRDPAKAHAAARNSTGRGGSPIRKGGQVAESMRVMPRVLPSRRRMER
jgi:hypothetical protein